MYGEDDTAQIVKGEGTNDEYSGISPNIPDRHTGVVRGKSLDDTTFPQDCKDALIAVMLNYTVVTNLTGGHLALLFRLEGHIQCITAYVSERV